ncbi:MAG: histidine kinase [Candidatus Eisenbacteria bacterium]|nr:histidine kinase [Candidatus Eisenbacteria bacterium]
MMNRRWLYILGLWIAFGVFYTLLSYTYLHAVGSRRSNFEIIFGHALYIAVWIGFTPLILRLAARFRLERTNWRPRLLLHLGFGLLIAFPQRMLTDIPTEWMLQSAERLFSWTRILRTALGSLDYGVFLYLLVVLLHHAWEYARRLQEEERLAAALRADLAGAQLQALQLQLQPHFLFNTLNAISVLVRSDPEKAETMLRHLSSFLRATLDHDGRAEVTLAEEMELLDRYLEIARTRFGDRLSIERQIDDDVWTARVPFLILQPLVENALRHGIGTVPGPGRLTLTAHREASRLQIEVSDNGPGVAGNGSARGTGLANTESRLRQLYGDAQRFSIGAAAHGGCRVWLELPFRVEGG